MDQLMELEGAWDALEPFGPQDAPFLASIQSLLDEADALPSLLESDALPLQPHAFSNASEPTRLASASSASSSPAPLPASQRKRRRPQDEIDALHTQVYELTARLDALRFQEAHGCRVDASALRSTPPAARWQLLRHAQPSCRAVAGSQREARRRAELENLWLRALVRSTAARAKRFQEAFERHVMAARKRARMALPLAPRVVSRDSEPVFAELLAGLDALYLATDEVLAPHEPIPAELPVQQLERRAGVFGEPFLAFLESRVLPFQAGAVERALWRALLGHSTRVYPNFHRDFSEEISDDAMLTSSRLGVRRGDCDLDIWIHIATRRYVESGRVVVVSRSLVKPTASDSGVSVGVGYRETRLRVLRRLGDASAGRSPSTVMQSHHAVYRESAVGQAPSQGWSDGQDTAFAAHGWRHSIAALNQAVENLVLDELRGRST